MAELARLLRVLYPSDAPPPPQIVEELARVREGTTRWERLGGRGPLPTVEAIDVEQLRAGWLALAERRRVEAFRFANADYDAQVAAIAAWQPGQPRPI